MSKFREVNNLGNYLGVILTSRYPKIKDYRFLLDKINKKQANWKGKKLSFVGRVTIGKSVIVAILTYSMMTTILPKTCLKQIQAIQRRFIWGYIDGAKHFHTISWKNLTKPKHKGASILGISGS